MIYTGCITQKRLIKERVYITVEADSEEEALECLKNGDYEFDDETDELADLGVVEILNKEITGVYDEL